MVAAAVGAALPWAGEMITGEMNAGMTTEGMSVESRDVMTGTGEMIGEMKSGNVDTHLVRGQGHQDIDHARLKPEAGPQAQKGNLRAHPDMLLAYCHCR